MIPKSPEITDLLHAWANGDEAALEQLTPKVYAELHQKARLYMRSQRKGHTLQTTALVNEVFLRLLGMRSANWQDRVHFFAVCASAMRQILVSSARARRASKRGGQSQPAGCSEPVNLDQMPEIGSNRGGELIALDDALKALSRLDSRKARVIELRFFGGLSVEETAAFLKLSPQSVMRDWKLGKAWLLRELKK